MAVRTAKECVFEVFAERSWIVFAIGEMRGLATDAVGATMELG